MYNVCDILTENIRLYFQQLLGKTQFNEEKRDNIKILSDLLI